MTFDPNAPASAGAGIFGLDVTEADASVVLVPVPYEATVSYGSGARGGPEAILEASKQVDLYDLETGSPYEAGIFLVPADPRILELDAQAKAEARKVISGEGSEEERARALHFVNEASNEVNERAYRQVLDLLQRGKIAGAIGGDHSCAYGPIRAHAEHYGEIGVLHVDAHADLREAYMGFTWSHASIMNCVLERLPQVKKLVQLAIRDLGPAEREMIDADTRIDTYFDPVLARARARGKLIETFELAVSKLPEKVYVSVDIDGLDPRYCPSTGTPVPGGLDFNELSMLLEAVVDSGRTIVGFDLMEVAPGGDEWDGNVGARVLYKLIGWTLKSRK